METQKITETTPDEVFENNLVFTNKNGLELPIEEIIKQKVISVVIAYMSKEKIEKSPGLKGFLGFKEKSQENKILTIKDDLGIAISFTPGIESASIRFSEKNLFNEIADYDESTLWKRHIMTISRPYQLNFHILNLREIDWK